jgi:hypothetical protein
MICFEDVMGTRNDQIPCFFWSQWYGFANRRNCRYRSIQQWSLSGFCSRAKTRPKSHWEKPSIHRLWCKGCQRGPSNGFPCRILQHKIKEEDVRAIMTSELNFFIMKIRLCLQKYSTLCAGLKGTRYIHLGDY